MRGDYGRTFPVDAGIQRYTRMSAAMLSAMRVADSCTESPCDMGIARRGLDLSVAEQLSDHGQALAERQSAARIAVSEVVKPDILQPGTLPVDIPGAVDIAHAGAGGSARYHPGVVCNSRQFREYLNGIRRQGNRPGAGFAVT